MIFGDRPITTKWQNAFNHFGMEILLCIIYFDIIRYKTAVLSYEYFFRYHLAALCFLFDISPSF